MKKWIGISALIVLLVLIFTGMFIQGDMGVVDSVGGSNPGENVTSQPDALDDSFTQTPPLETDKVERIEYSTLKIIAAGDLMFHMPQINSAKQADGSFNFFPPFEHVTEYIQEADMAIANLETVTGGDHLGFSGFPRFNSPEAVLDAIAEAGFDVLVTSNNHTLDRGKKGIINTIDKIKDRGLEYIGTSKDTRRPYIVEDRNDIKVGILSYTYGLNGLDSLLTQEERSNMVNLIDKDLIREDIRALEVEGVDLVMAYLHWGYEYHSNPSQDQIELSEFLSHSGVDIILGTHPHVVQKVDIIHTDSKMTLVVYSMGNFISNQRYDTMGVSATEDGMMIQIEVEKDMVSGNTHVKTLRMIPTWIHRSWQAGAYEYRILPVEAALEGELDMDLDPATVKRLERSLSETTKALGD